MNEYELIGRLANLDTRLKKLEGAEPVPQPAPVPKLVEAVEEFILGCNAIPDYQDIAALNKALAREKQRQELVEKALLGAKSQYARHKSDNCGYECNCEHCLAWLALDAFDNQGRRDSDKDGGK